MPCRTCHINTQYYIVIINDWYKSDKEQNNLECHKFNIIGFTVWEHFFYNICTCEPRNEVYFVYKALSSHRYGTLGKTTYSWRLQKYFQARSTSFNILWSCTQRCKVYKYLLGKKENYLIWICRFKCWKTILISILFLILQWMKKGCSVQTMKHC